MHLKDTYNLSYHEIALLIDRDDRTVWTCYNRVKKKEKSLISRAKSQELMNKDKPGHEKSMQIPLNIIRNRDVSILESIVFYLKESSGLSYHEIALLLNRNDRTIWTVYNRTAKKMKGLNAKMNKKEAEA